MSKADFLELIRPVTRAAAGRQVDAELNRHLAALFPPDGDVFGAIEGACRDGIAAGWMCAEGGEGRRFGRIFEAGADTDGLSVDVVDVDSAAGPHHRHPKGEILMIMPITPAAKFDGHGRGWLVYEPGTGHRPTVTAGEAVVLYLLPDGEIDWTE
ncbi:MAG: DUF4863 family protein [Alphaproteobacteria bacterium]|jgi:hypothetical protein|nr:DUF4863 family protein [Alphaproteobacteria bacterium]MDP6566305.1 DUF4863 family protein [Alphaproteobacteria bacterium]MDP6814473.1 DUF4863 family protein [Alphaproteobacteria bacterium]